jgi:hypothetical protein
MLHYWCCHHLNQAKLASPTLLSVVVACTGRRVSAPPARFPSTAPRCGTSFPSQGSSRFGFPWFNGTMKYSDFRPSFSPRFVVLRLAIPPRAPVFVSPLSPTPAGGLEFSGLALPANRCRRGDGRFSQVPGRPAVSMPCSSTPAGPPHQAIAVVRRGPRACQRRRLPRLANFGAQ